MSENSVLVDEGTAKKIRAILELTDKYTPVIKLSLGSSTGLIDPMASGGMVVISGQPMNVVSGQVVILSGGVIPISQVSGGFNVSGGFTVSGGIQVSGTLAVSGQIIITSGGTIPVGVISGAVNISGGVTISGGITVSGGLQISGTVAVSGQVIITSGGVIPTIVVSGNYNTYSMVSPLFSGLVGTFIMGIYNAGGTGGSSGLVVELLETTVGLIKGGTTALASRWDVIRLSGVVSGIAGTIVPTITTNPASIISGVIYDGNLTVSGIGIMHTIDSFSVQQHESPNVAASPTVSRRYDYRVGQRWTLLSGQSFALRFTSGGNGNDIGMAEFVWVEKYP